MSTYRREVIHAIELRKNTRSDRSGARAIVLLLCLLSSVFALYPIKPVYGQQTLLVPSEYDTIQEAVNNATAGDTIKVAPGLYTEHVVVTKSLTIVGEDPQTTIIDGTANGTVFDLEEASNVNITGFTIRNAGNTHNAIASTKALPTNDYHWIANNIITTSQYGVFLSHSQSNTIFNNTFISNAFAGICLNDADHVNITANTIVDSAYGIKATSTLDADIIGNTISQPSYAVHLTASSTGTTISRNIISGKTVGIYSSSDSTTVDHNTIKAGAYGVYFYNCYDGTVSYNAFLNNSYGIRLYMASSATSSHDILNNKLLNTDWAIELVWAHGNMFTGNWLQHNTYGIYLSSSSSNIAYHNNFVNNDMQVYAGTGAGNQWDNGDEGNYWSDYTGVDEDPCDGIGDTAYRILPLGFDYCPLMTTWSEHDISIQNVTLSTHDSYPGAIVNITVIVRNNANLSVSETFHVTAKYDFTVIDTQTVTDLAQGATESLTFNWNTTGVAPGNYTIRAEAEVVPDELHTDNNRFIDGVISIKVIFPGDIDRDGIVNGDDVTLLMHAYGATSTSSNWDPDADLNEDGIINELDLYLLSRDYGKTA